MSPNDNSPQNWRNDNSPTSEPPQQSNSFNRIDQPTSGPTDGFGSEYRPLQPGTPPPSTPPQHGSMPSLNPLRSSGVGSSSEQSSQTASAYVAKKKFWTKGKKISASVATVVLVLLAGSGAAFAFYNNSDKVVGDALANAMTAETSHLKGDLKIGTTGDAEQNVDITLDYDVKTSTERMRADFGLDVSMAPISVDVSGGVITETSGDAYFKIDNLKAMFQNLAGGSVNLDDPSMQGVNEIIAMIDNKWVKVTSEELKENMSEEEKQQAECVETLSRDLVSDKQLIRDVTDVYRDHVFINTEQLDSDDFSTLHYKLSLDEQKTKDFVKGFEQTQLFDRIKDCDKEFAIDTAEISESVKQVNKANMEVWIDRWSHKFTKVHISGEEEEGKYSLNMDTTFDTQIDIEVPQDPTLFKDVVDKFEGLINGSSAPALDQSQATVDEDRFTTSGQSEQTVLGSRTDRLLEFFR